MKPSEQAIEKLRVILRKLDDFTDERGEYAGHSALGRANLLEGIEREYEQWRKDTFKFDARRAMPLFHYTSLRIKAGPTFNDQSSATLHASAINHLLHLLGDSLQKILNDNTPLNTRKAPVKLFVPKLRRVVADKRARYVVEPAPDPLEDILPE